MIDEFMKYVSNFDVSLDGIKRKISHSVRVMRLSRKYAMELEFDNDDVELASLIGLLHDIGRFYQYQTYHSFNDFKTIDHADYGVKILFEDRLISKFTNKEEDYELIRFAIKNHNKLKIEDTNDSRFVKFARLIRDVDKLDIVYLLGYLGEYEVISNDDDISDKVVDDLLNNRPVDIRNEVNTNDHIAVTFGLVYDINYDVVLGELKRNYYYYYKRVNNNKFKNVYDNVNKYIDGRIKNVG